MIKLIALKRLISSFMPLSLPTSNQLTNKKFVETYAILLASDLDIVHAVRQGAGCSTRLVKACGAYSPIFSNADSGSSICAFVTAIVGRTSYLSIRAVAARRRRPTDKKAIFERNQKSNCG